MHTARHEELGRGGRQEVMTLLSHIPDDDGGGTTAQLMYYISEAKRMVSRAVFIECHQWKSTHGDGVRVLCQHCLLVV